MGHPTKAELIGLDKQFCSYCNGAGTAGAKWDGHHQCPRCWGSGQALESRLVRLLWSDDLQARVDAGDWAAIELAKLARNYDRTLSGAALMEWLDKMERWAKVKLPEDS